jgi:hypothetical protein
MKDYRCDECPPEMKTERGCRDELDTPLETNVEGVGDITRCPVAMITPLTWSVLDIYNQCRTATEFGYQSNGILPGPGGLMNQSDTLMKAFAIIDGMVARIIEKRRKK